MANSFYTQLRLKFHHILHEYLTLNKYNCIDSIHQTKSDPRIYFPRQSLNLFTFRVKLSHSIFFLLGLSTIVKLI